jgi:hypothetical protein
MEEGGHLAETPGGLSINLAFLKGLDQYLTRHRADQYNTEETLVKNFKDEVLQHEVFFGAAAQGESSHRIVDTLNSGISVNAKRDGKGALHSSKPNATRQLLEEGADTEPKARGSHWTPLVANAIPNDNVTQEERLENIRLLLATGARYSKEDLGIDISSLAKAFDSSPPQRGNQDVAAYLEKILSGKEKLPTPESVGLNMTRREAALEALAAQTPGHMVDGSTHKGKPVAKMGAYRK